MSKNRIYGHIDGYPEGSKFKDREEVRLAGLQRHPMKGIDGTDHEAACAIVLSGGYEDDIDHMNYIIYTGKGGRDNKNKQISHQEFTGSNKSLILSCEYRLPVRVIRGYQIKNGPNDGYRYDGLYFVESYERVIGKSGFYVCKYHLCKYPEESYGNKTEDVDEKSSAGRASGTYNRLIRNTRNPETIKEIYRYKCQICNIFLKQPSESRGIAVGAHIKGLGNPHDGPDTLSNMLCLCPNHHAQFDKFSFYIEPSSLKVIGLDGYENIQIKISRDHKLNIKFLEYHKNEFQKRNEIVSKM